MTADADEVGGVVVAALAAALRGDDEGTVAVLGQVDGGQAARWLTAWLTTLATGTVGPTVWGRWLADWRPGVPFATPPDRLAGVRPDPLKAYLALAGLDRAGLEAVRDWCSEHLAREEQG